MTRQTKNLVYNSSVITVILGLVFAFAVFLSKIYFDESRQLFSDFRTHISQQETTVGQLKTIDENCNQRLISLEAKFNSIDRKLEILIAHSQKD